MVVPAASRGHPHRSFSRRRCCPFLSLLPLALGMAASQAAYLTRTETWVGCMTLWDRSCLSPRPACLEQQAPPTILAPGTRSSTSVPVRRTEYGVITCPSHCHASVLCSPGAVALRSFPPFAFDVSTVLDAVRAFIPSCPRWPRCHAPFASSEPGGGRRLQAPPRYPSIANPSDHIVPVILGSLYLYSHGVWLASQCLLAY